MDSSDAMASTLDALMRRAASIVSEPFVRNTLRLEGIERPVVDAQNGSNADGPVDEPQTEVCDPMDVENAGRDPMDVENADCAKAEEGDFDPPATTEKNDFHPPATSEKDDSDPPPKAKEDDMPLSEDKSSGVALKEVKPSDNDVDDADTSERPATTSSDEDSGESSDDEQDDPDDASGEPDEALPSNVEDLTEDDLQKLVDLLVEVEHESREAHEALEEESLARTEREVRIELRAAGVQSDDELNDEVEHEMRIYRSIWQKKADASERKITELQELLENAGVNLAGVYIMIEKQAAEECVTDAWRKRTHWAGRDATAEYTEVRKNAEKQLATAHPVMMRRGKLIEEGASGFLGKKIDAPEGSDIWKLLEGVREPNPNVASSSSFGSREWAAVYSASTPEQAVRLGLKFPGADKVDEIGDIEDAAADAAEEESKNGLTEEQKKSLKRVREEDDLRRERQEMLRAMCKKSSGGNKRRIIPTPVEQPSDAEDKVPVRSSDAEDKTRTMAKPDSNQTVIILSDDDEDEPSSDKEKPNNKRRRDEEPDHPPKRKRLDDEDTSDSCVNVDDAQARESLQRLSFVCSVCAVMLQCNDVEQHPVLEVIVCKECKNRYEGCVFWKVDDGHDEQCRWCAEIGAPVPCDSCEHTFCEECIERNLGAEGLASIKGSLAWPCFVCDPTQLKRLSKKLRKALRQAATPLSPTEEAPVAADVPAAAFPPPRILKHRKNIKKVLSDDLLSEKTKQNLALEKERRERLEAWYASAGKSGKAKTSFDGSKANVVEALNGQEHLCEGDCANLGCVINIAGRAKDEPVVRIPASLSRVLKSHQLSGVRFMWENCVQSVNKVHSKDSEGLGCILAHSMGLGKTLQVISFLYTVMRAVDLGFKTAMVVLPVNVLQNWSVELRKWKPTEVSPLSVYMVEDASRRITNLATWRKNGGVLLIGYHAFRLLVSGKNVRDKETRDMVCECLQNPGPDILVCDEAHGIKGPKTETTLALKTVRTQRRIAITGSPLQNNLMEYYAMVDFVREGYLGAAADFRNRYQNPIANGQHKDSTAADVRKMKQRAHILNKQLKGFVQRKDVSVLKDELPPKSVWMISIRLSQLQRRLYRKYLALLDRHQTPFIAIYGALAKIWNHPDLVLLETKGKVDQDLPPEDEEKENENEENALKPKVSDNEDNPAGLKPKANENEDNVVPLKPRMSIPSNWWQDIFEGSEQEVLENSGKIQVALKLMSMSSAQGEKVLVFTQSLGTLDLMETFLERQGWTSQRDWYRIDGKTKSSTRQWIVDRVNDASNVNLKCVLISTKAGSLGINLIGATRVVIMDGSWNPTHDLQAMFRAWRIGQKKPVHVYRLLAYGTMEEKIYNRQIAKESVALRVLDEHQVGRHLKADDLDIDYTLDDEDTDGETELKKTKSGTTFCAPSDAPPRDELLAMLLLEFRPQWIVKYHEHEPLLENLEEENLTAEEKAQAWDEFRNGPTLPAVTTDTSTPSMQPPLQPTLPGCNVGSHARMLEIREIPNGQRTLCTACNQLIGWMDIQKARKTQRPTKVPQRVTPVQILHPQTPHVQAPQPQAQVYSQPVRQEVQQNKQPGAAAAAAAETPKQPKPRTFQQLQDSLEKLRPAQAKTPPAQGTWYRQEYDRTLQRSRSALGRQQSGNLGSNSNVSGGNGGGNDGDKV